MQTTEDGADDGAEDNTVPTPDSDSQTASLSVEMAVGSGPASAPTHDFSAFDEDRDFVTALARGLMVITAFTNQGRQLSISQISYRTGITRAAVRRYLHTLTLLGFARCHPSGRYSLTPKAVTLGNAYLSGMPLGAQAQPVLDALAESVGEACSMAVLDDTDIVYLMRASSSRILSPSLNVGSRLPAYATSIGLVLLAHLTEEELSGYLARTRFLPFNSTTVIEEGRLRQLLAAVRQQGYALADQQMEARLISIAVPVVDRTGTVICGINVIADSTRVGAGQMRERFLTALRDAARRLADINLPRT